MKPAPFVYFAPETVEEALALLAEHGDEAKVLAGGQSLIPTMNFRLAQPAVLVDLGRLPELSYIRPREDGGLAIGTMTRHRAVERSATVRERAPLVHGTMPFIAHPQIRNRGTFGGSIAHADPAAELPAVALALDAEMVIRSQASGERTVAAKEFFVELFTTALGPEDLLVEVRLPAAPKRTGWSFHEFSRRHGDYALVGVAGTVTLDEAGRCRDARLVYLSVGEKPTEASQACAVLVGEAPTDELCDAAARTAAEQDLEPPSDIHASTAFRRHLATVLGARVLKEASARAAGGAGQ